MPAEQNYSFEEAYKQLSQCVKELEQGNLTLENSIEKYRQGMNYLSTCRRILTEVEKKIELITRQDNNKLQKTPFPLPNSPINPM
ncbi:MAG TPA: exodeoxyribonuclease VII small subunit [Planctomycetota bacterium]|nr:exodeoxyribonuclease VII small subunit [Planctomycetota bacterium]